MAGVISKTVKVRNDIEVRPLQTASTCSISFGNAINRKAFVTEVSRIAGGETRIAYRRAASVASGSRK